MLWPFSLPFPNMPVAVTTSSHVQVCLESLPRGLLLLPPALTDSSSFAPPDRFHYADDTAGLQGWLKPVGRIFHVGHVNAQAAILTQQDHCCPLLLIASCVPNGNHVLDLGQRNGISSHTCRPEPTERGRKVTGFMVSWWLGAERRRCCRRVTKKRHLGENKSKPFYRPPVKDLGK